MKAVAQVRFVGIEKYISKKNGNTYYNAILMQGTKVETFSVDPDQYASGTFDTISELDNCEVAIEIVSGRDYTIKNLLAIKKVGGK